MAKDDKQPITLTAAAAALEAELERFEALAASLGRMPLGSKKHLERAARTLQEAGSFEDRLAAGLRGLGEAINAAAARQQASAAAIISRAREIEARNAEHRELAGGYAALGAEAEELTAMARQIAADQAGAASAEERARALERTDELLGRLSALGDRAHEIARAAAAKEIADVARDADALKQQIQAARSKLLVLRQGRA